MSTILSEKYIKSTGGFWNSLNWKNELGSFISKDGAEYYSYLRFTDSQEELQRVFALKDITKQTLQKGLFVSVNSNTFDIKLIYAGLRDLENTGFDLIVNAKIQIAGARDFLNKYALEILKANHSITSNSLEAYLYDRCKAAIIDETKKHTYDYLKNHDALPTQWWQSNLSKWFNLSWLKLLEVSSVSYESESVERASEMKKRQELLDLDIEEQNQIYEHELKIKQQEEAYKSAKIQIENDRKLSEKEQQLQLEELEHSRQEQELKSKLSLETIRLEGEKRKIELEAEIERIRNNPDSAKEMLQRSQETEQRNIEIADSIKTAIKELAVMSLIAKDALKEGLSAKERISVSASGVSSKTMELLGKTSGPAYLAQILREKASNSDNPVMMKKIELRSRDIGHKKVDSLKINSSLQFEFLTERSGYATILNIGTSGRVWLQCPNIYVGIDDAKIEAGDKYQIPGQLLPGEALSQNGLSYIEIGPPGWEELVVIISDNPLAAEKDLFKSTLGSPFVEMSQGRLDELLEQLSSLDEKSWDVGILSFLVE